jgi:hypothetical protein
VRVPGWAPARPQRQLGQRPNLGAGWFDEIPSSIGIAAVGGVVAYAAGVLPDTPKIIVRSIGFLAIGYAIIKLFLGEKATAAEEAKAAAEKPPVAIPEEESFLAVTGKFVTPGMYTESEYAWWSKKYTVELSLSNQNPKKATAFLLQIIAKEMPYTGMPLVGKGEPVTSVLNDRIDALGPNQTITKPYQPALLSSVTKYSTFGMELTARITSLKTGDSRDVAKVSFTLI